jgi:hypothetical protein
MPTIKLDDETDRWRWTCPQGHRNWEPTNNHFWCQTCAQSAADHGEDVDPVFNELRDESDGETYGRDQLKLITPLGPYEARGSV